MPFSQLPPMLGEALAARGYAAPTPVQAAVLEPEAEGRDLIVSAQTGSGKTVAFGLAMAPQLIEPNEIGRAHVGTPVTNAHLVCRLTLEKTNILSALRPQLTLSTPAHT